MIRCPEKCGKQWRLKQGKSRWQKQKKEEKRKEERKKQEEKKWKREEEEKIKLKRERTMKVKKVAKEWNILNEKKEAAKSEKETK